MAPPGTGPGRGAGIAPGWANEPTMAMTQTPNDSSINAPRSSRPPVLPGIRANYIAYCDLERREPFGLPFAPYRMKEGCLGRHTLRLPVTSTLASRWAAFNAIGAIGVVVQIAVFACLSRAWHWHYLWATATAVEAAVLHNFAWHQRWTWSHRPARSPRVAAARFLQFQLLNGSISLVGNLALMRLLTGALGVDPIPANIAAICFCASLNFAAGELIVFRRTAPTLLILAMVSAPTALRAQSADAQAAWTRTRPASTRATPRRQTRPTSSSSIGKDTPAGGRQW